VIPLELLEHLFCILDPDKRPKFSQKLEEWESPLSQSRNKPV
jgi:hypothetical protein